MISVKSGKIFTAEPDKGNLAGVVLDAASMPDRQMQEIAHVVNASETAFVLPSELADIRVRWFTPSNEVGICVHATIAAAGAWLETQNTPRNTFRIETRNSILNAETDGKVIYVNVPGYMVENREIDQELICRDFEILPTDLYGVPKVIRIFEDLELVVPLRSLDALKRLNPSVEKYTEICRAHGVTGLSLFSKDTLDTSHDIHLREFAPLYGYLEDPLCGMAAGCVLTYLRTLDAELRSLKIEQGHFCNTSGTIYTNFKEGSGAWIGGEYCFGNPIQVETEV